MTDERLRRLAHELGRAGFLPGLGCPQCGVQLRDDGLNLKKEPDVVAGKWSLILSCENCAANELPPVRSGCDGYDKDHGDVLGNGYWRIGKNVSQEKIRGKRNLSESKDARLMAHGHSFDELYESEPRRPARILR